MAMSKRGLLENQIMKLATLVRVNIDKNATISFFFAMDFIVML
uniref:Uncharacterized protein n=1 Tax=Oryza nivara TaxID=4536 RepID=A0A0E0HQ94_ORYNI